MVLRLGGPTQDRHLIRRGCDSLKLLCCHCAVNCEPYACNRISCEKRFDFDNETTELQERNARLVSCHKNKENRRSDVFHPFCTVRDFLTRFRLSYRKLRPAADNVD